MRIEDGGLRYSKQKRILRAGRTSEKTVGVGIAVEFRYFNSNTCGT